MCNLCPEGTLRHLTQASHSGIFVSQHSRKELDPVSCNGNQTIMWEIFYWTMRYWTSLSQVDPSGSYLTSYLTHDQGARTIRSAAIRSDNSCKAINAGLVMGWSAQRARAATQCCWSQCRDGGEMPKDATAVCGVSEAWFQTAHTEWYEGIPKETDFHYQGHVGTYC